MRFVRLFVGSILVLFLIATGISLFLPSRVRISRATNIAATPAAIWASIDTMQHWPSWNPFFEGVTTGAITAVKSDGAFTNSMEVNGTKVEWIKRQVDERIAAMTRPGKLPVHNGWRCITHTGSDSTTLQWYMDIRLRWYPWEKLGSIMFERTYGPAMEKGLGNIRTIASSRSSKN